MYDQYFIDDLKGRADLVRRSFLSATFVASLVFSVVGQEQAEAILVDEIGGVPCGDFIARLDRLYFELSQNPNSLGFIVIANSLEKRRDNVFLRQTIEKYTRFRRFDLNRLKIIRTSGGHEIKVSLWHLPDGASPPTVDADESYKILTTVKRPFLFASKDLYSTMDCPEYDEAIFARFLNANPTARANLVFRDASTKAGRRRANQVVLNLVQKYGISRNRIRVFFVKQNIRTGGEPITELWYLP